MEPGHDERRSQAAGRTVLKTLTLLRHAKSSWDDSSLPDHDRKLSRRGLEDAPRMGQRLAARGAAPELILSSTAVRARRTAELVAAELNPAHRHIELEPRIYLASPGQLLAIIAGLDDGVEDVMIVGHNPGLTELVNMLLPSLALANLPTAGVVAVVCRTSAWRELDSARFTLGFFDFPKNAEPAV